MNFFHLNSYVIVASYCSANCILLNKIHSLLVSEDELSEHIGLEPAGFQPKWWLPASY